MKYEREIRGLEVAQHGAGWHVCHAASKLPATPVLRQRRFAEQARDELLATGVDFTRDAKAIGRDRDRWAEAYRRWHARARQPAYDEKTGEYYSSHVSYGTFVPSAAWAQSYRDALEAADGDRLAELIKGRRAET
jgi:hypothetical protein